MKYINLNLLSQAQLLCVSQFSKQACNDFVHTVPGHYFRELLFNKTVCCFFSKGKAKYHTGSLSGKKTPNFCFNDWLNASPYFVMKGKSCLEERSMPQGIYVFAYCVCWECSNSALIFSLFKNKTKYWFCNCWSIISEKNLARPLDLMVDESLVSLATLL